jgi:hypothetical protein
LTVSLRRKYALPDRLGSVISDGDEIDRLLKSEDMDQIREAEKILFGS